MVQVRIEILEVGEKVWELRRAIRDQGFRELPEPGAVAHAKWVRETMKADSISLTWIMQAAEECRAKLKIDYVAVKNTVMRYSLTPLSSAK
jgi:hypothetical protein